VLQRLDAQDHAQADRDAHQRRTSTLMIATLIATVALGLVKRPIVTTTRPAPRSTHHRPSSGTTPRATPSSAGTTRP
jgi:hypothetical protein